MNFAALARGAFAAGAVTLAVVTLLTSFACGEDAKSDSERLADRVGAQHCVVPPGRTGVIHTCEFGERKPKRCYAAEWVPPATGAHAESERVFRTTLRHQGACTRDDKP